MYLKDGLWKVTLMLNTIKSIDKVQDETHCCCPVLIFDNQLIFNLGKASNVHNNLFIDYEALHVIHNNAYFMHHGTFIFWMPNHLQKVE
jgi:hypothetical protein